MSISGYSTPHSCEILAWCPVEIDKKPLGSKKAMLEASRNFTVLIKNQIEFPLYNKRRTNILESSNQTYLSSCLYNNETDPFCPVFRLDTIVKLAGEEYSKISVDGAVVSVGINWDCDLGK
jgi:P2X purinoceptor 4